MSASLNSTERTGFVRQPCASTSMASYQPVISSQRRSNQGGQFWVGLQPRTAKSPCLSNGDFPERPREQDGKVRDKRPPIDKSNGCHPAHLRIDYPRQILWFRPFQIIGRAKIHGFEVVVHV